MARCQCLEVLYEELYDAVLFYFRDEDLKL